MSRRDDDRGYSESRRHQSKPERDSSPKRSKRDVKIATEDSDRDQKHHRRLQDALPLDDPKYPDSKLESGAGNKKPNKKDDGQHKEGPTKHSSDRSDLKSYSQHDEHRGNSGRDRASKDDGRWKDSSRRGKLDDRKPNNRVSVSTYDSKLGNSDRSRHRSDKTDQPPLKKRTFTERKVSPTANENGGKEVVGQRNERERRDDKKNGGFQSRGWFGGGENSYYNRGRDNSRQGGSGGGGYRGNGVRAVEKWKHDLFDEANRSPSPKKDEDMTAKIESLLAS
ncbi:translation initiation factor IF-2 [Impatiens glandulifera]|uniref:translation initiation factor IF-2 n=1 Tax=Impatiens glandulifera TaxID=253017 RepID=UPI001FB05C9D|nr:translation initiation factor IF-2 [Impatiens glandulifera]XP_047338401.1 translation initiation factor IF-2 [Impatiens glandulifera]